MFSKYLTAFIFIIFISFIMLSGIITSIIEAYDIEEKEKDLVKISDSISSFLIDSGVEELEKYPEEFFAMLVVPIVALDDKTDVIITDENGNIILTTINSPTNDRGEKIPIVSSNLGSLDIDDAFSHKSEGGDTYFVHYGRLGGLLESKAVTCAMPIITNGELRGYAISTAPSNLKSDLIVTTRRAVITNSAWVMLAAVIAIYFITEKIIHPLRSMTKASKSFASGDFSTRVTVYGEDEVAELGNAFNNMAESLERLETMRSSFLASVSHDLKTPMTTIAGFIEGINSGAIPPEKHEYYLGVISSEVHRLSRLVSQLLDVSRLESGDRKFDFVDFDVAELSRIVLISFEQKIEDKRLEVSFDAENDKMLVNADKDAIHQVLYNLCHNAIKFSNDGGRFEIKISRIEGKKIKISVFDEGQIIPEEDIAMIFERFYKSDKSRGLDRTGVGLGLYISKTIIDAHSQEIHVKSSEGVGTEFWFTLKESDGALKRGNEGDKR